MSFRRGPGKYGNVKTLGIDGTVYDSKREARTFANLHLLTRVKGGGQIRNIRRQVPFELLPKNSDERACSYVADFTFEELGDDGVWREVVADAKGKRTTVYILKRKMMRHLLGIKIREL